MPNQNNQQPNINSDEMASSLAFATMLSENLLKQQNPQMAEQGTGQDMGSQSEPSQTLEMPQGEEKTPESMEDTKTQDYEAKMAEMEAKMDKMKVEMESMIKGEISSIKDIIIDALKDDGQE